MLTEQTAAYGQSGLARAINVPVSAMQFSPLAPSYSSQPVSTPPRVCILGGGFGGLYTALYLHHACQRSRQVCEITLIEPRDRFAFTPLLYELLTAEVQPWEVVPSYTELLRGTTIRHLPYPAEGFDLAQRRIWLSCQDEVNTVLTYDYLVVAMGSRDRPLPIPSGETYASSFRTWADVQRLDEQLADLEAEIGKKSTTVRIALVGAGASGVELACKLADRLGPRGNLVLIDRGDRVLSALPDRIRRGAVRSLARRQVKLLLQTTVTAMTATTLTVQTPTESLTLPTDLVLNTTGVQPRPWLGNREGLSFLPNGTVQVRPTLQLPSYPEVLVLGDQAAMPWQPNRAAPATAQAAFQAADRAARNLLLMMQGRSPRPFQYHHLGHMMTLGNREALVASAGLVVQGRLGSLVRQAAYTYRLPPGSGHRWRVVRHRLGRWVRSLWPKRNNPLI